MKRNRVALVVGALLLLVAVGIASRLVWTDNQVLRRELRELQDENHRLQDQLVSQRELLREQTLSGARRSPDELLGLFPARFPKGDWRPAESQFEDCWFTSADGLRLHGWLLRHPTPRAIVLHLHGNAGNLTDRAAIADAMHMRHGVSVLIFDYRGYGRSEGTPTMQGLLSDARAARTFLATRELQPEERVVLLGESLGGALAVDLAAENGARGLILESTFSSLRDVAQSLYPPALVSLLVADKLNSADKIGKYRGPLLQVHGDADSVVPLASAKKLFTAANQPKQFVVLRHHDHNDPPPEKYHSAVEKFLTELP